MSIREDARRLAYEITSVTVQLRRQIRRVIDPHATARTLFLDEKGELTPTAAQWFFELAQSSYVETTTYHDVDREMVRREARRELAMELMKPLRLDVAKLAKLRRQLNDRETEHD